MNIFFAAAIRGGRSEQPVYAELLAVLKEQGTVLNEHVADETISDYGETNMTKQQIHEREMKTLMQADVIVAEVTTPSLGVGYLIARALDLEKRVICLYRGENTHKLSAMIKGDARVEVVCYTNVSDVPSSLI